LSHTHYTRGREQEWLRSATALEFAQGGLLLLLLLLAAAAATAENMRKTNQTQRLVHESFV
jgi:hypothetical protein